MSKERIRSEQFAQVDATLLTDFSVLEISQEQLDEMSSMFEGIFDTLKRGKLVTGTVVKADSDGVLVDINYKSYGFISRYEFTEAELKNIKKGDTIEVILDDLENNEGNVALSYEKAKALRAWDAITKLFENEKPVEGIVTHKVKGGLNVDVGVPAFLPGSQIDLQRVTDFDQYVGQTIVANILKINKKRGNVIISRRKYLSDQRTDARKKVLDVIDVGAIIPGQVKNITNYGAFIDIGGVDGLLHITDMTWGRISHPSELLKIGDAITVKVLSFDKDNQKISLGLKQLTDNPWEEVSHKLNVGEKITGTISSITDYGLFVKVEKGVEGLVHISEISWTDRINDLNKKYKVGEKIEVVIVSLNIENRRMSLSIKQLKGNPWSEIDEKFKVGDVIKGVISNITDFGIFVQLLPGIDGLVHISDLSWTEHISHPGDIYKRGDEVSAVILSIEKGSKKISLGIKQLSQDPWVAVESEYPVGTIVDGVVSKITTFGAFVKLASGIEGLVHISELSSHNVEKVEDVLKVDQKAQFRVINVNKDERKLGLSLRLEATPAPREKQRAAEIKAEVKEKQKEKHEEKEVFVANKNSDSKPKSMFQIELEKHAARAQKDDDK